jgi:ABC-type Fe3+/spermidine/putrescine transport system ATPase subunit
MSLLNLKDITKIYGTRKALDNFSLKVMEGERVALLGPSGCGKTTALRLLAGFESPDRGQVEIAGVPAAAEGRILLPPEARSLGMVFQDLALWPHFTVRGNLEFGLKAKGVPAKERKARIREMLERVELLEYVAAKPAALSGGQQQRVALARALVLRPRALLMDEPLSSLDVDLNRRLREEILRLHQEFQFALLYVTHDRGEASALTERVVLMKLGQAEMEGTPDQVRSYLEGQSDYRGHW